jgi:Protoporphyrinogen oxidase
MNILVVGGGIVGLATAYKLGERYPDATITVSRKRAGSDAISRDTTAACCMPASITSPDRLKRGSLSTASAR